jgi:hypothetical protein
VVVAGHTDQFGARNILKSGTKAERDAHKAFRKVDAEQAMTEHEIAQKAFRANRERLKAERLTREAAGTPAAQGRPTARRPRMRRAV